MSDVLNTDSDFLFFGVEVRGEAGATAGGTANLSTTPRRAMKVNPDYELPPDPESCLRKINDHLAPWLQAAPDDPEVAAYLLGQLRINLPHSHLDKLLEK